MPWYYPVQAPVQSFELNVEWPLGGDFVKLSDEDRKLTGIVQYRILKNEGNWVYDYAVEIDTEFEDYDYKFTDGESDVYSLRTNTTGTHSFKYNSGDPAIKKVSGVRQRPPADYDYSP
jgi:hypothetical protein